MTEDELREMMTGRVIEIIWEEDNDIEAIIKKMFVLFKKAGWKSPEDIADQKN